MIVPNQTNLKVHYAGAEAIHNLKVLLLFKARYLLYTAFPFVDRLINKKSSFPMLSCELRPEQIPSFVYNNSVHSIQDSGLFSLMFGSKKGTLSAKDIYQWYDGLVAHTTNTNFKGTCVEVDCQKILGVESAWEFREKMKLDLPNNRQINVFHKEDGQKGLDRLIEFSDYIAISVPELRALGKKNHTNNIAHYIKNKKPSIDIHLLGCTENKLLQELNFCSSADSTTWLCPSRFGYVLNKKVSTIDRKKVMDNLLKDIDLKDVMKWRTEQSICTLTISILSCMNKYKSYAGNQD